MGAICVQNYKEPWQFHKTCYSSKNAVLQTKVKKKFVCLIFCGASSLYRCLAEQTILMTKVMTWNRTMVMVVDTWWQNPSLWWRSRMSLFSPDRPPEETLLGMVVKSFVLESWWKGNVVYIFTRLLTCLYSSYISRLWRMIPSDAMFWQTLKIKCSRIFHKRELSHIF